MIEVIHPMGGMNQDAAIEAMPKGDYPYALNCIRKESGEYGTITNALGNELVTVDLPAGDNMVIGQCEDKEDQAMIYFLSNSNDDHCIIRYSPITDVVDFLLEDIAILNFSTDYKIFNPEVVGSGDEKLLFWTDNLNRPRKLNIEEADIYTNGVPMELAYAFVAAQCTIQFKLPFGKQATLDWGDGNSEIVWGEDDVIISRTSVYTVPGDYDVVLEDGTINITYFDIYNQGGLSGDVSSWSALINLEYLDVSRTAVDGDISSWSALINLEYLYCGTSAVDGDISSWSALTKLIVIACNDTIVAGDISSWSALTNLTIIICDDTSVEGDVSSWSALVNLDFLECSDTSLEGDVSGWNALVNIQTLRCYNTSIDGNISSWSAMTDIVDLRCYNTYVSGDVSGWNTLINSLLIRCYNTDVGFASPVPSWANNNITIDFTDCEWTAIEVDNCLIALSNGPVTNCTINIAGTNAARTAASNAAVIIINANGNALTVN